ncbi:F-box/kelch-repeat protein At1g22040 [Brassica napus]|uniref:F-box/kelch-repeat protein At1g22040 n=1 Tax=Brassica napus TaxID=3708 RepID=UPI0020798535|nr:F-box/kelch-repeat protein At1g22040 [Brassica napus]XP_013697415.2 F-box/kelch-repeat protein At1g22040 [Brassica napus]XP_048612776.1 F-box/kelch-repeat protein At1g22040 [Brassica napus]
MGSVMSLSCSKRKATSRDEEPSNSSRKRRKLSSLNDEEEYNCRLIPNLPDELSIQILARLPRICYSSVRLVSRRWRSAVSTSEVYALRKELGITEEWLYVLTKGQDDKLLWYALDPVSTRWQRLPPMPVIVCEEESRRSLWNLKVGEIVRSLLCRRDASEQMPFCGCAIGSVDGCLYVLGGLSKSKTVSCVWRFDPIVNSWSEVSSMLANRAYSKTGVLDKKLYVVGGVDRGRGGLSPLQTAEVYDPTTDVWSQVPSMPFTKAQVLPNAFLADLLKPIATGMTCYNGRLCVPQSLYSWPFFVDVGGEVYDPETELWGEMPSGMGEGWPARQAGTKLSVVVDGELYAFDPSSSMENGKIKVYDQKEDAWKVVIGEVPVYDMTDSESPYLLAGFHGKLHFITRDHNRNVTVLRADVPDVSGSSSSSKCVLGSGSFKEKGDAVNKSDTVIWKVIASKDLGAAELVSCQVIDI